MDGKLGAWLTRKIEERIPGYRVLGYFENGYRHVSNRLRPVRTLADLKGMRMRLMPGQDPRPQLRAAGRGALFARSQAGTGGGRVRGRRCAGKSARQHSGLRRAQGPPLPHPDRPLLSLARHLPEPRRVRALARRNSRRESRAPRAKPSLAQRELAVEEEQIARKAIEGAGGEVLELTPEERAAFVPRRQAAARRGAQAFRRRRVRSPEGKLILAIPLDIGRAGRTTGNKKPRRDGVFHDQSPVNGFRHVFSTFPPSSLIPHPSSLIPRYTFPALRFSICCTTPFLPSSVSGFQMFLCLRRSFFSQMCVASPM